MLLSSEGAFISDPECGTRFQCPRCHHFDHNGGSAFVIDWWSWRCTSCRAKSMRMELEDAVMRDPGAVFRLALGEGAL